MVAVAARPWTWKSQSGAQGVFREREDLFELGSFCEESFDLLFLTEGELVELGAKVDSFPLVL